METQTIRSYLYQQYQNDLDLQALVDSYNELTQSYVDWCNTINLPIYTGLSGKLLDWIGSGLYGLPRKIVGSPSGAVYNTFAYNDEIYGAGSVSSITVTDDVYKRILTWKLYRGDGFRMTVEWLKRRLKRFLVGANGACPEFGETKEISVTFTANNGILIVIDYATDPASVALLVQYLNTGILDLPWLYDVTARSA